ncbi:hypothetical protein PVAP13_9KG119285, partial [Panicum virgatum]
AKQRAHLLQRPASSFREVGEQKHPTEHCDASVEEEAAAGGDGRRQGQKGHGDHAARQAVAGHAELAAEGSQPLREDLGAVNPRDGAEAHGEEADVRHVGRDTQGDGPRDPRARVASDDGE